MPNTLIVLTRAEFYLLDSLVYNVEEKIFAYL